MLVVEVLSLSTPEFDKGEKFEQYKQIESLRHVLFVEQDHPAIEHWERDETGQWISRGTISHLSQAFSFVLSDNTVSLQLSEVYERIVFTERTS